MENYYKFTPAKEKKDTNTYSSSYSQTHTYPLLNYVHKKMHISYSKNCSVVQNNRPKLILPNYSMGYPILDIDGILDVGGRVSYYLEIPDDNIAKLKKIQKLFMTDLALTIINSLKTAQKFISTRTFSVFPDVTKMNISIDDDSLAKYYNLNSEDKKSIVNQKQQGEGNLSNEQKEYLLSFSLYENITKAQKVNILSKTKKCKLKERKNKTRKKK